MKRALLVISILFLFGIAASADVLGPPTAGLKARQWSAGAEYFLENTDLKIDDSKLLNFFGTTSFTLKKWRTNRIYGVIGYGLTDAWEVFARLGASNVNYDDLDFSSGFKFSGGFGTKYTFIEDQTLPWGALFQINWLTAKDDGITVGEPGFQVITGDAKIDWQEIKIVVGPTYNYSDKLRLYGGLGAFLLDHEFEDSDGIDKISVDVEEKSSFAGFIGAQLNLNAGTLVNIEGQFTKDSWGIGAGIIWKL